MVQRVLMLKHSEDTDVNLRRQSGGSARYDAGVPLRQRYARTRNRNWILSLTFSQCSSWTSGVTCSDFLAENTRRACPPLWTTAGYTCHVYPNRHKRSDCAWYQKSIPFSSTSRLPSVALTLCIVSSLHSSYQPLCETSIKCQYRRSIGHVTTLPVHIWYRYRSNATVHLSSIHLCHSFCQLHTERRYILL